MTPGKQIFSPLRCSLPSAGPFSLLSREDSFQLSSLRPGSVCRPSHSVALVCFTLKSFTVICVCVCVKQAVTYQTTVFKTQEDFNAATGHFTCRVPGVYYFTFNSVAKVRRRCPSSCCAASRCLVVFTSSRMFCVVIISCFVCFRPACVCV